MTPLIRVSTLSILVVCLSCGDGRPTLSAPETETGTVSGFFLKGRGQRITLYRVADGARSTAVGSAQVGDDGTFSVGVGAAHGPFLLVASGGSLLDDATGATVPLNSEELTTLLPSFSTASHLTGVSVSPISHLTAGLALRYVRSEGLDLATAYEEAAGHLHNHFGGLDWRRVAPTDLTTTAVTTLDDSARAGLLHAALSQQARLISEATGLTPGARVTGLTLTQALYQDLTADGFFDGASAQGTLSLPSGAIPPAAYQLSGSTARADLAHAVARFLESDRNASKGFRPADVQTLVSALAGNSNSRIFRTPGGLVDIDPPSVAFVTPAAGSGINGTVSVTARCEDPSGITSCRFTAPQQLAQLQPSIDGTTATLTGPLDVSSTPDGPLTITVRAEDPFGNATTQDLAVIVSNRGPSISITAPSEGNTLSGNVTITAAATAQQGAVRRLELRNPPPGVGADTLPAADSFAATWDTRQPPEGAVQLTFRAEDEFGAITDATITVQVDNVPFGSITAVVSAGAPVAGATVKLVALDDAGQPATTRPGGAVLGQGGPTEQDGRITFTLSEENWDGPVQLQASGTGLSYVDPSDGTSPVAVPSTFTFTSAIPRYRTGDALTAPVTLYTTLADSAASAFGRGRNPSTPATSYASALGVVDPLFEAHVSGSIRWPIRTTVPVSLTQPPTQTLRDVVYAALPDVALNQLARRVAISAGLTPVQGFDALKLVALLQRDVSDGTFDGHEGGLLLRVLGSPHYELSTDELRVRMALALDAFVTGSQNRTGLTRADLRAAEPNIYDSLSLDQSALFGDAPPVPFDTNPPEVTWRITFTGDDGVTHEAPVGAEQLVANTLALEVTAVDPEGSGVRALTVTAGGNHLNGQTTAPGRVTGTWTPTADGTLELLAVAEDGLGNRAEVRRVVRVDNTPPEVAVTSPATGLFHGSGALQLASEASDSNGVASQVVTGLPGATVTGTSSLTGTWTPAANLADGPLTSTWTACDQVGNCRVTERAFNVDRTAPLLSYAHPPPRHTNASTITITLAAADSGAGVAGVYGRRVDHLAERIAATLNDGVWSLTLPASGSGEVIYSIWGEDRAAPLNSGEGLTNEHRLQPAIIRDVTAPVVELLTTGFYRSEQALRHQESAPGVPAVPVIHTGLGSVVPVVNGASVHKLITRVTPGNLSAEELATTNASNTPWLAYSVLYSGSVAGQEAPITEATYSISCAGCGAPSVSTGSLLHRGWHDSGRERFALPLTSATIPGLLDATTSPVTLTIRVTVRDAAGNTTTSGAATLTYHLVSPTVSIQEVTNYSTARDAKSPYAYRMQGLTYDDLWESATPAFEGLSTMRVARFRVRNPHPVPIAVNLTARAGATWAVSEEWADSVRDDIHQNPRNYDGFAFNFHLLHDYQQSYRRMCEPSQPQHPPYPCPTADDRPTQYAIHVLGDAQQWRCVPVTAPTTNTLTAARTTFATAGYLNPDSYPTGGEPEVTRAPGGYSAFGQQAWLVPAASGNAPGQLTLYVLVPRNRAALPAFTTAGTAYEYLHGLNYGQTAIYGQCRDPDMNRYFLHRTTRRLHYRTLSAARVTYTLPFTLNSIGTNGATGPLGAARAVVEGSATADVPLTHQ
ncbi:Ig-like domain-containing protein [Myxococcus vastator]|uniref:Ig-like domain-containing protein n=1 Tax=Myxococcus vastator TaxID=2709664 RepID=UPI0013D81698|nr:Ig-like domain-containing protein [Myxococcus vastator]